MGIPAYCQMWVVLQDLNLSFLAIAGRHNSFGPSCTKHTSLKAYRPTLHLFSFLASDSSLSPLSHGGATSTWMQKNWNTIVSSCRAQAEQSEGVFTWWAGGWVGSEGVRRVSFCDSFWTSKQKDFWHFLSNYYVPYSVLTAFRFISFNKEATQKTSASLKSSAWGPDPLR